MTQTTDAEIIIREENNKLRMQTRRSKKTETEIQTRRESGRLRKQKRKSNEIVRESSNYRNGRYKSIVSTSSSCHQSFHSLNKMLFILIATLLITLYAYYKMKMRVLEKFAKKIPGDDGLPILGNVAELIKTKTTSGMYYKFHELADQYSEGGIRKFWLGTKLMISIWDPEYIEVVANSPHTVNKGSFYTFLFGTFATGLFVLDGGSVWKELRRPLAKTLKKRFVEEVYLPVFVRRSKDFIDFIEQKREGKYIKVDNDINALTFAIVFETLFGINTNEVWERRWEFGQIIKNLGMMVNMILKYQFNVWKILYKFTSYATILDGTLDNLSKLQQWIIDERRTCGNVDKEVGDGRELYPDFLLRRAKKRNIPDVELQLQITDLIVGGVDTAGVTISSALVFLAMCPEVQERVHDELADIFQDSHRQPSMEDLKKMSYLEMVIKETLRYVTPPAIIKSCQENLTIGKYTLPKGCYVMVFTNRVHHDPKYWERPHSFYPEHFLAENEAKRPTFAYIPFGCGPRACPGSIFGMCLMKVIISTILRSFRVTTNQKFDDIVYDLSIMLHLNSYEVKFERKCT